VLDDFGVGFSSLGMPADEVEELLTEPMLTAG
jgi:hypothetical protein